MSSIKVGEFILYLDKISDPSLKAHKLSQWLLDHPAQEVVHMLNQMMQRAIRGDNTARSVLNPWVLTHAILENLTKKQRFQLLKTAAAETLSLVHALFADFTPKVVEPPIESFRVEDVRPQKGAQDDKPRDPITLGERRSLAKVRDPRTLEKIMYDPDPKVIQNLLDNPHFVEKHVLMVTSRKPNRAAILTVIGCHRRWGQNIRVRQSLILNPFTPPIISVLSLVTASHQNLKEVKNDGKLHPLLRDIAKVILSQKE